MPPRNDAQNADLVELLAEREPVDAPTLAPHLGLHPRTVRERLKALERQGVVRRSGRGRGTLWHLG